MKLYKCEMCGKKVLMVQDHHIIPWWCSHDDSEDNIMRVCRSCHSKADVNFNNLILRSNMNVGKDTKKRISKRYTRKYVSYKSLYFICLLKNTYYYERLQYNIKTDYITIKCWWRYDKPRRGMCSGINIQMRAKKAALVKGQTTLN